MWVMTTPLQIPRLLPRAAGKGECDGLRLSHGSERQRERPQLGLPGRGVHRLLPARQPPAAALQERVELHAGQLHQVPDRHMGVAHRPRGCVLLALRARICLPVHTLHAEV